MNPPTTALAALESNRDHSSPFDADYFVVLALAALLIVGAFIYNAWWKRRNR